MSKDTTNNGVSDDNDQTSIDKLNASKPSSEREDSMSEIAANARKAREVEHSEMDITNDIKNALEGGGPDLEDDGGKPDPDEKPKPVKPDTVEMVLVKINGSERRVPKVDVDEEGGIIAYQKSRSADEKMRQNAAEKKALEERERLIAERELAISTKEQASLSNENINQKPSKDVSGVSAEARALKDKMYSGNEDVAAEAIQELLDAQRKGSTQVDTQTVINQVTAQVQRENDRLQAVRDFKSEYSEIDSNPEYRKYADQATLRIHADNPDWTPRQVIMEAGEQARLKFADQIREMNAADEDNDRLDRKRATDNVKGADAKVQSKPPQKAKTQSQIIEEMKAGRSHSNA